MDINGCICPSEVDWMELSVYRSRSQPQWRTGPLPNRLTGLFLLNFIGIYPEPSRRVSWTQSLLHSKFARR